MKLGCVLAASGIGIAGLRAKPAIAFVAVVDERDRRARLAAADADVRNAVRRRTEVRMERARAADEVDERVRLRIDRRAGDLLVPPVVGRKGPAPIKIVVEANGGRGRAPARVPAQAPVGVGVSWTGVGVAGVLFAARRTRRRAARCIDCGLQAELPNAD